MVESNCHRDLTRKTKIKGLTANSWLVLIILGMLSWFIFLLWAIPIVIFLFMLLWVLEFFDEDIYQIIYLKFQIKTSKYYA